ncbi:uncharacterized protein LOC5566533 isoform X2 [Aedes aegypti]|uniref:Uncharacterized protein n=1 Tax=Aedes aegypti TaxID=7159 RepID=A0A6I8TSB1_AEDAE|nr:uncharacterized protein LOC5566533 isoform X2 [Aedes aegypti]
MALFTSISSRFSFSTNYVQTDKVSTAACLQTAALQEFRKQCSSKNASTKKGKRASSFDERYEECLEGPAVATEEIIAQLLKCDQSTKVVRTDDITMRESTAGRLSIIESTLRDQGDGFGEMKLQEFSEFLGSPSKELSALNDTHNDSGIEQDTTNANGFADLPLVTDQTMREVTIDESPVACTSIAMMDVPIASVSTAHMQDVDMSILIKSEVPDPEHTEKTLEISRISDDTPEALVTTPERLDMQQVPPLSIATEEESKIVVTVPLTSAKKSKPRRTIIDQKTKLDFERMKRAIETSSTTQRCKNPRYDIVSLEQVRHPFDHAVTILQHPVRSMRSSVLPGLFIRNTRKRTMDVDDSLLQEWNGHLELRKRKRTTKEPIVTEVVSSPPLVDKSPSKSPVNEDVSLNSANISQQEQTIEIIPLPVQEDLLVNPGTIEIQPLNSPAIGSVSEIDETSLMILLTNLRNKGQGPISMKSLESGFCSKLDAATCFSTILVLIAKRKLRVIKNGSNEIADILPHF